MASDANPVQIPAVSLVHGSQAPTKVTSSTSGKSVPPAGNGAADPATSAVKSGAAAKGGNTSRVTDVQAQVAFLNKYLNDSGKPAQFRVAPNTDSTMIQEINPATGEVIADYSAITFPALAKSLGISSAVIDEHA
jgi:hypothetical protein